MAKNGSLYHGKTSNSQRPAGARNKQYQAEGARRRTEAKERQAKYDLLTPQQHLQALDRAFGVGQGAKKERAKLQARITSPKTIVAKPQPIAAPLNVQAIRSTSSKDKRAGMLSAALVVASMLGVAPIEDKWAVVGGGELLADPVKG